MQIIRPVIQMLTGALLPPVCSVQYCTSKRWGGLPLCKSCLNKLKRIPDRVCPKCGLPDCQDEHEIWDYSFEQIRSLFFLNSELTHVIHGLKYRAQPRNGRFLAHFLRYYPNLLAHVKSFDFLAPVPLHSLRKRERGYNQSLVIAKTISEISGVTMAAGALKRTRYTKTQTQLSREQRLNNLQGAFKLTGKPLIKGRKFLLVDDVFTTGSTVEECTRILLQGGAAEVGVFTLARATTDQDVNDYELELQLVGAFAF
jgi:ComF family protein